EPGPERAEGVAALIAARVGEMLLDSLGLVGSGLARIHRVVLEPVFRAHAVAGDVVEDRIAEHGVERVYGIDVACLAADHDGELRLRVHAAVIPAYAYRFTVPDETGRRLQEKGRVIRRADLA